MARSESNRCARVRRKDRRGESRMMVCGLVIAGIVSVVWMWREQTRARTHVSASDIVSRMENEYRRAAMGGRADVSRTDFAIPATYTLNGPPRPAPVPRYYANLATDVGDYVVSVRQVITDYSSYNLFLAPAGQHSLLTDHSFALSIQVLAKNADAFRRIRDYAVNLTAVDDQGDVHPCDLRYDSVSFPNGLARLVHFHGVDVRTRYLKELTGEILLSDADSGRQSLDQSRPPGGSGARDAAADPTVQRLKFAISNVPLPMNPLVYGVTAARYVTKKEAQAAGVAGPTSGQRCAVLTGDRMAGLRRLFPPYVEEPEPLKLPSRLIMIPDVPNRLNLGAVGGKQAATVKCALTPRIGEDGDIRCGVDVTGPNGLERVRTDVDLWDREQAIVVLPAPGMQGKTLLALLLHLYLDVQSSPPADSFRVNPFLARSGDRGGVIVGEVHVRNRALRGGVVQLEVARTDERGRIPGESAVLEIAIDRDGGWELPNLAAGHYDIKLRGLLPSATRFGNTRSPLGYMRHRFGFKQPAWNRSGLEHVALKAGGLVRLAPWVLADAADGRSGNYLSMAR